MKSHGLTRDGDARGTLPAMRKAVLFDDGLGLTSPLTDLRPAFDVRTGALTTLERLVATLDLEVAALYVPQPLGALTAERHPYAAVNGTPPAREPDTSAGNNAGEHGTGGPVMLLSGRLPLAIPELAELRTGDALVEGATGHLVAALCDESTLGSGTRDASAGLTQFTSAAAWPRARTINRRVLISRPWHVRTFRDACIDIDLSLLHDNTRNVFPTDQSFNFGRYTLTLDPTARVYPGVIIDRENGPVFVGRDAIIRPGAIVIGPAYVGPHSTVLDRALIKPHTAIGPWCKVAGEVGGTIFQGYANKAHDGHLGDSWVGEWANLGAGTTNSNLLNTYAEVTARTLDASGRPGPNERTGEQFLGAIIGDHAKAAICTRIMTGAILGTGVMCAATAAANGTIPPFSWCTDAGTKPFRLDKFTEVARTVMSRRKLVPSDAYLTRLADLHARATSTPGDPARPPQARATP